MECGCHSDDPDCFHRSHDQQSATHEHNPYTGCWSSARFDNTLGEHGKQQLALVEGTEFQALVGGSPQSGGAVKRPRRRYRGREENFLNAMFDLIQYPTPNFREQIARHLGAPSNFRTVDVCSLPLSALIY